MPICSIFSGYIVFVYIGTNIDKSNTVTHINKTDMSIENWIYQHVFLGTGIDKTDIDINPHVYIGLPLNQVALTTPRSGGPIPLDLFT
jgi:hypothetical protein